MDKIEFQKLFETNAELNLPKAQTAEVELLISQTELQKLVEATAELNSPEMQTAMAELGTRLEQQQQMTAVPLNAKMNIPYTDTAEYSQKISKIEQELQEIHRIQEVEQQVSKKRDQCTFLVAILTLIATVVIGVISLRIQLLPQQQNRSEPTPTVSEFPVLNENS